jgi:hypothetical protein
MMASLRSFKAIIVVAVLVLDALMASRPAEAKPPSHWNIAILHVTYSDTTPAYSPRSSRRRRAKFTPITATSLTARSI